MSAPGLAEWVFLAVLALLIFGPDKLPGMARSVGRTIASFKREASQAMEELRRAADVEELRAVGRDLGEVRDDLRGVGEGMRRDVEGAVPPRVAARRGAQPPDPVPEAGTSAEPAPGRDVGLLPPPFDPDAT